MQVMGNLSRQIVTEAGDGQTYRQSVENLKTMCDGQTYRQSVTDEGDGESF